jgi:hypothetical protein
LKSRLKFLDQPYPRSTQTKHIIDAETMTITLVDTLDRMVRALAGAHNRFDAHWRESTWIFWNRGCVAYGSKRIIQLVCRAFSAAGRVRNVDAPRATMPSHESTEGSAL